ncbi:ion transporter [bacterium]|nr:ion transporter [bacterium]
MRETLHRMFHDHSPQNRLGTWYGRAMTVIILLSLLPLCFKGTTPALTAIDLATTAVFIVDYALRWATSDLYLRRGARSFLIYPFTPMAIVDLVSILPAFSPLNQSWRLGRLFRLLRIVRAFKLVRYSRSMRIVERVLVEQRHPLGAVVIIAIAYVLVSALVVFNVEPETFDSLYDAVYWAVISLTTVGYGDIYPQTDVGRFVAMVSAVMGIAVVALPSGIITAGLMDALRDDREHSGRGAADGHEDRRAGGDVERPGDERAGDDRGGADHADGRRAGEGPKS